MSWVAQSTGAYTKESSQAKQNAVEIYNIFSDKGFTLNAIAGVLGNIGWESGYNPWRWQGDVVLATNDVGKITGQVEAGLHAYGLFQFDPSSTYVYNASARQQSGFAPNFSDVPGNTSDGMAQCLCVSQDLLQGYYQTTAYPLSFQQFKASTQTPEYLALAWLANYERGVGGQTERQAYARYWYDILPTLVSTKKGMSWIYYLRKRR